MLWLLAAEALIGGIDRLLGNRLGLGERFEEGFRLLGPTALSMAGILCLSPLIVRVLSLTLSPLWQRIGLDPGMLGGFIPIDMGGYQAAVDLASDPTIGLYAGILVSATTGCTLAFTIPMGMGLLSPEDTNAFSRGILIGLIPMPAAQILGGLAGGMQFLPLLKESIPILLFSAALMLCLHFAPEKSLKVFGGFAKFLRALSLIGLTLGAVQYIGNIKLLPSLMPLEEAMQVVASIGIVMLGSLPAAELLRRGLSRPFSALGRKLHMDDRSFAALLVGFVSATPAISMIKNISHSGKVSNDFSLFRRFCCINRCFRCSCGKFSIVHGEQAAIGFRAAAIGGKRDLPETHPVQQRTESIRPCRSTRAKPASKGLGRALSV